MQKVGPPHQAKGRVLARLQDRVHLAVSPVAAAGRVVPQVPVPRHAVANLDALERLGAVGPGARVVGLSGRRGGSGFGSIPETGRRRQTLTLGLAARSLFESVQCASMTV
jgi:hypothetical protein